MTDAETIMVLEKALGRCGVAANHLPIIMHLLGAPDGWERLPNYEMALHRLGSGAMYETWCAWFGIREALDRAERATKRDIEA